MDGTMRFRRRIKSDRGVPDGVYLTSLARGHLHRTNRTNSAPRTIPKSQRAILKGAVDRGRHRSDWQLHEMRQLHARNPNPSSSLKQRPSLSSHHHMHTAFLAPLPLTPAPRAPPSSQLQSHKHAD